MLAKKVRSKINNVPLFLLTLCLRKGKMKDKITHIGTIEAINENKVSVRILQSSACSGCHAAGMCQSSESKEKVVDVYTNIVSQLSIGQKVIIEGSSKRGLQAVLLAYILPLIIIVLTLSLSIPVLGEPSAALLSLVGIAIYYAVLYTQKNRLKGSFSFQITRY